MVTVQKKLVNAGLKQACKSFIKKKIPSYRLEDNTAGAQLVAFAKRVDQSRGMGIFMFHGIGSDYISTSAAAHQELLDYLTKNKKDILVATFQQATDWPCKLLKPKL
jgi:hypothetical protein